MQSLLAVENEIIESGVVIKAAEDWSDDYRKQPEIHAKLIRSESKMELALVKYFRDLASRSVEYIDWMEYYRAVAKVTAAEAPYDVEVIIKDDPLELEDGMFMNVIFDPIATETALGAQFGEAVYDIPIGITETDATIQRIAREHVAELVGKRVDKDGNVIENPKAKYRIGDKTRTDIRESIRTSINLGEDQKTATARLTKTIRNPKRAAMIASTESVNAFQGGLYHYAKTAGAVAKEWQTVLGACIRCVTNANAGPIPIDQDFPSGHKAPSCHPWDRCGCRYIWPEELQQ